MIRILTLTALFAAFGGLSQEVRAQDPSLMIEGAKLWSNNCLRCHNARSSMERNDHDWETIVTHMRVRANLSKSDARAIVAYIQLTNMPEPASTMSSHRNPVSSILTASTEDGEPQMEAPMEAPAGGDRKNAQELNSNGG